MVLCSVSAFGRVDNDYAFGYVAVLRRPRSGVFSGGRRLPCVCVVVSVGVLVFVGYTMTCFWWVFVVAVFVLVFCFVGVVCLVWCVVCLVVVFAGFLPVCVFWCCSLFCGLCHVWFYVGIRVSCLRVGVSCAGCLPLVGVRCLALCVCLPLVGVCRRFLRWVFAFGGCIMASFVCVCLCSALRCLLLLGVCRRFCV